MKVSPRWLLIAAWVAAAAAAAQFAWSLPVAATRESAGFPTLYTAGRLVLEGSSLSRAYDDAWFGAQVHRFFPSIVEIFRPNPPAAALIAVPVAWLPPRAARVAWTLLSLAVLVAVSVWALRRLAPRGLAAPACALVVFLFQPFRACLHYGQAYIVLLGLLVVGLEALRHERPRRAGAALGALFGFKAAALFTGFVLLSRRRRRALAWGVATVAAIGALSLLRPGADCWRAWLSYLSRPSGLFGRPEEVVTAYQTLPGFIAHLTRIDARLNPSPLFDAPAGGRLFAFAVSLLLLGASLERTARNADPSLPVALLVLTHLVVDPWTLDYHYPLAFLPLVVVACALRDRGAGAARWALLALGTALLSAPAGWCKSPSLQAGALALLAYPQLYGALLVWGLAFHTSGEGRSTGSVAAPNAVVFVGRRNEA